MQEKCKQTLISTVLYYDLHSLQNLFCQQVYGSIDKWVLLSDTTSEKIMESEKKDEVYTEKRICTCI